jgi:uncharacterized membrane protein
MQSQIGIVSGNLLCLTRKHRSLWGFHGYILNGKKFTKLDDPKGQAGSTTPGNLNPDGAISVVGGYVSNKTGSLVGFLYGDGKYADIRGPSGAVQPYATGINDSGAIVGAYADTAGVHGFLLQDKKYTTLEVPGASITGATGINKSGKIVLN